MPHCKETPGLLLPCGDQKIQGCQLCCPTGTPVGYLAILSARNLDFATTHLSEPQAPCFAILLVLGSFPSTEHWGVALSLLLTARQSPCSPFKEQECQIPHWGDESYNLLLCTGQQKPCSPKTHSRPAPHTAPPCMGVTSLLPKSWNPISSTEWQPTTLLVLGGLPHPPHFTETQCSLLWLQESPYTTIKEQELQSPHWWQKRDNLRHNRNTARGNISSTPISEEHCWNSRRKKLKTPTTGAQDIKTLSKNNSRCFNFNAEWNSKTIALHQKPIPTLRI
jgi:hypothetical protein